jgi:LacI family transcriptional regulator
VSLVAFDDVPWMSMVSPGITTVDQHTDALGRTSAQLVVERISGAAQAQPAIRYVEPSIVLRGSTGPPPRRRAAGGQAPAAAGSRRG